METNFKKLREVFVHNGMKNKNLFHIFHRCHQLGESKPSFSPFFQVSNFSCFSPDFAGAVSARWRRNWRNQRRFFLQKNSYTITSYSFCIGVTIEEKWMSELTPFLQQFDPSFMADSSRFLGILFLFLAEVVESDFLSLRGDLSYLFM
jgi:hypothetical protein